MVWLCWFIDPGSLRIKPGGQADGAIIPKKESPPVYRGNFCREAKKSSEERGFIGVVLVC